MSGRQQENTHINYWGISYYLIELPWHLIPISFQSLLQGETEYPDHHYYSKFN